MPNTQLPPDFTSECRRLAAALQQVRGRRPSIVVAVTSPDAGAGVTTVARCLARYLAQSRGSAVLRIDAAEPGAGVSNSDGRAVPLSWAAAAQAGATASIAPTTDDRLSALAIGTPGERVTPDQVRRVHDELRETFAYVVVDCAPLLADPDPTPILQGCDGALLVLDARALAVDRAREATAILRTTTRPLGLVVNRQDAW